ncbi:MAG: metallophosphoesterase [Terriglobales bacterium]
MAGIADATVQVHPLRTFSLRARIAIFVGIVQSILLLTHWFIYDTWTTFRAVPDRTGLTGLQVTLAVLSVSFVAASLLAFRYYNWPVRAFYRLAAAWLGTVNFLFLAACLCWAISFVASLVGLHLERSALAGALFGLGMLASLYGVLNARWTRIRRIKVKLPDLPVSWRGRVAALVSDVHLGHVNGTGFLRRVVGRLTRLQPDVVFITGDLYDGTKVNAAELASPWKGISPPWGTYFITGNHEEFSDPARYLEAVEQAGVRVLQNEKVLVDGLQIVGVHFHESTNADRFRSVLKKAGIVRQQASILLSHAPHALSIAAEAGISMQLSGHTHGGQIFPFTWFTRRIFGAYTYGLQRFAGMLVYTTTGAGTWGPPMRVGTNPEIVLIEFA